MFFSMRSLRAPRLNETTKLDRLNIGFTRFSINDADMNGAQQKLAALAASTANHIIIQSEREEFMLKNREKIETSELQKLQLYYSCNSTKQISNLIEHKIKIFNSTSTWTDFLCKNCDLTVSSRIHGCIASLNAGKPALLLHHDVRTSELAKVIGIPSIPIEGALKPNAVAFRKNIIYLLNSLKNDDLFESCQARNLSALKKVYASNKISVNMR